MHPSHVHAAGNAQEESVGGGSDGVVDDNEVRAASRKLAESQETALAQQTRRQSSTEECSMEESGELCLIRHNMGVGSGSLSVRKTTPNPSAGTC